MLDEWIAAIFRRFGRPSPQVSVPESLDGSHSHINLTEFDLRIEQVEREQREQEARLRALESQVNPRRIWRQR